MAFRSSSKPILALLWFSPLVILALTAPSWLLLLCVVLLFVYGLLLFRAGEKLSESYRPSRFFPWFVWVLSLFGLTNFQALPVPVFPANAPVKDLYSAPLSINHVHHGMSPEEVFALHGEPTEHQIQHTILPVRIDDGEIQILMAEVLRLRFEFSGLIHFANREQLDFLLSKQIGASVRAQETSTRLPTFDGAEVALDQVRENLKNGFPLLVYAVEEELTTEKIEDLVNGQDYIHSPSRAFLFVNKNEAVYTRVFAKEAWSYSDRGLEVVFGPEDEVVSLRGGELWLGTRLWARTGDPVARIQRPGEPLHADEQELRAILSNRLPGVTKKWGSRSIGVHAPDGIIEFFEL